MCGVQFLIVPIIFVLLTVSIKDANTQEISIDQAISDNAQNRTIAFSNLAFLTGTLCEYTFFPPGKVSDFFGFQYLRDTTPNGFGHNTEFAGRVSDSVLSILSDSQVQELVDMANTQAAQIDEYGYKRFVLIKAFRRLLENDIPDGSTGLDAEAVKDFTADLYEIDGEISYTRAMVLGGIVSELSDTQKTDLVDLLAEFNALFEAAGQGGIINSTDDWPAASPVDLSGLNVSDGRVLVSTYADQLFSWYLGSVEGDTYFCPERHGTYFGSFYMKDVPPLRNDSQMTLSWLKEMGLKDSATAGMRHDSTEAVSIDPELTSNMGAAFFDALNESQAALVSDLVTIQKTDLLNIVSKREEIAIALRGFMNGSAVNKASVLSMVREYGEYEGSMMYYYATNFAAVGHSLTADQNDTLMGLRIGYYELFPEYQADSSAYDCTGAWLYSMKMDMPEIENTDFLFENTTASTTSTSSTTTPTTTTPTTTTTTPTMTTITPTTTTTTPTTTTTTPTTTTTTATTTTTTPTTTTTTPTSTSTHQPSPPPPPPPKGPKGPKNPPPPPPQ